MAAVSAQVFKSIEGSSIFLNYDDSTLILSGMTVTGGNSAEPLICWFVPIGETTPITLQISSAIAAHDYTLPSAITGTRGTDRFGNPITLWFDQFGCGHGLIPPTPPIIVSSTAVP